MVLNEGLHFHVYNNYTDGARLTERNEHKLHSITAQRCLAVSHITLDKHSNLNGYHMLCNTTHEATMLATLELAQGMNNASKNKNGLHNVMPTILCFLSLIASANVEKKAKTPSSPS